MNGDALVSKTASPKSFSFKANVSNAYVGWVVAALGLVQTSSFADRTVISVLQPPIKQEFGLSDFEVGLLGGFAFAAIYAVLGLPIARIAEHRSRRIIISCSLLIWSAMTTLCGFASSYLTLFFLRFGVGVGEAGSSPASHSMLADYVAPAHRGKALSIFSIGSPVGAMLGFVVGGIVAQLYGWRPGFIVVGLPGLILALIVFLTVKEPGRRSPDASGEEKPRDARQCFRTLLGTGIYRHCVLAQVLMAIPGYGLGAFATVYLTRAFGFTLAQAGIILGVGYGISYSAGLVLGGFSHDRQGFGLLPALATLTTAPVAIASFLSPQAGLAVLLMLGSSFLQAFAVGPTYAVIHNRVSPDMRCTAIAVLLLMTNLVGAGLGPAFLGLLSDRFAALTFGPTTGGFAQACPGGEAGHGAAQAVAAACHAASTTGLRWAMVVIAMSFVWAAIHYLIVERLIGRGAAASDLGAAPLKVS